MATFFKVVVGINFNNEKALLQVANSEAEAREIVASLGLGAIKSVERIGDAFIAWELGYGELLPV